MSARERPYYVWVETPFYKGLTIMAPNKKEAARRAISTDCDDYVVAVDTPSSPGFERVVHVERLTQGTGEA